MIIVGILAASIGAVFPDADSDHSLINNRNPIFKTSNKAINYSKKLCKKIFAFIFFITSGVLISIYMYNKNHYPKGLVIITIILIILAVKGAKLGERIYIPVLTNGLKIINFGAAKLKKIFMTAIYAGLGVTCIYFSKGKVEGVIWGVIFFGIALFPHRTFLHAPEGIVLTTIGVQYLEKKIGIIDISKPFFIGYFSHLYLADIFTNSGVPISTIPFILKKTRLHFKLNKYKWYMKIYSFLNKKLAIPVVKTGSKMGHMVEGLYVFGLSIFTLILIKNRIV
jgi:hypothetical protein